MTRTQLDAELDDLARMLPTWLEKMRHPAQFGPQFDALAEDILHRAHPKDRTHARNRIGEMLGAQGLRPDARSNE